MCKVILDHVSGAWALDENVNGQGQNDLITVSWSIFAEGIPRHDKCALLASDPRGPQRFSFVKNLCAHNGDRNPDANFPPDSCVEIVNNVFYNAGSQFAEIWERSEEHTSELQSLMRISYAVFCLKKKKYKINNNLHQHIIFNTKSIT